MCSVIFGAAVLVAICNGQTNPQGLKARVGAIERRINTLVNQIGGLEYAMEIEREHRSMMELKVNKTVDRVLAEMVNLTANDASQENRTMSLVEELIRSRLSIFETDLGLMKTSFAELSTLVNSTRGRFLKV